MIGLSSSEVPNRVERLESMSIVGLQHDLRWTAAVGCSHLEIEHCGRHARIESVTAASLRALYEPKITM